MAIILYTMDIFRLIRFFWDYAFENTEKIKPNHCAVYFFAVEHCNRLGWKKNFGFPTSMVLEATGIKSYSVYKKTFDDLVLYGFIEVIEYSKNQYSSNIIALKENCKAPNNALDKAMLKHATKQRESTGESIDSIDKPITNKPINNTVLSFDQFWELYDKKVGKKSKIKPKFESTSEDERKQMLVHIPKYKLAQTDKAFRKDPSTYLNNESWNDEIIMPASKPQQTAPQPHTISYKEL